MPNPVAAAVAFLTADAANLPPSATKGTQVPAQNIGAVHVQYAWDGTPSDADNRENAAVRFTVWAPKGQVSTASSVAEGLRARVLEWGNAEVWRVSRGAGRLSGVDRDLGLPFCSFTVSFAMHALTP